METEPDRGKTRQDKIVRPNSDNAILVNGDAMRRDAMTRVQSDYSPYS